MLNVCNWTDKQLDELIDLLRTADHSDVARFIVQNFLCMGSRILSDIPATTLTVSVDGDTRMVDLAPGVFLFDQKVGQVDTPQTCAILGGTADWGVGVPSDPDFPRWTLICIKQDEQLRQSESRWFVDDSQDPNVYHEVDVDTMINKAFYYIDVIHGNPGDDINTVCASIPSDEWCIAEIYVPAGVSAITSDNIYDTTTDPGSQRTVPAPNWTNSSRVFRMEYYGWFEPGTRMPFHQPSAPTGWTKDATLNDAALRVVSLAGGGIVHGTLGISSTITGDHQLTILEMPSHHHTYSLRSYLAGHGTDSAECWAGGVAVNTGNTGGGIAGVGPGNAHNHPLALKYVDVIICEKD